MRVGLVTDIYVRSDRNVRLAALGVEHDVARPVAVVTLGRQIDDLLGPPAAAVCPGL